MEKKRSFAKVNIADRLNIGLGWDDYSRIE
jgi:hypothetical protein